VVYPDWNDDDLRYVSDALGDWTIAIVDGAGATGWYPSLAIAGDRLHAVYFDVDDGDLRHASRELPVDEDCDGIDG
jgi:hypothetical protein